MSVLMTELPTHWREMAETLRRFNAGAAEAFEQAAVELEQSLREREHELLTLRQAAAESGYTEDYLGKLVRAGTIENAGRHKAPKIRRADLPRKAVKATGTDGTDSRFASIRAEVLTGGLR